ncbi:helix-hairpin-helix domain-containing protein [Streptomyces sp. NPDC000345]|uniref:helix-hairpin-helix domain-containing protein n=1 Tax=Streptomyces sp. NPDC000345 TaxID=3364537 RepID=UPI0036963C1D
MALRSRSRTTNATSGPGRAPGSDDRVRRRPPGRDRAGHRHASAEQLRRRAETLFAARGGDRGGEGAQDAETVPAEVREAPVALSPPDAATARRATSFFDAVDPGDLVDAEAGPVASDGSPAGRGRGAGGRRWERVGPALWERMPVWVQARCGMERRSVLALTVVLVVAAGLAVQHFWTGRTQPVRAPEVVRAAAPYAVGAEKGTVEPAGPTGAPGAVGRAGAEIVVDVSGKVRKPGIHRLPAGSRVVDALSAAGGVRPGTNTDGLNRARFLVDGEQVVVGGPAPPSAAGASGPAGAGPSAPVSLNTATVDQLDTLPGVGPVLAQHIVDYRAQHGGFRSVDELRNVNGIGERRYADLRNLVRP